MKIKCPGGCDDLVEPDKIITCKKNNKEYYLDRVEDGKYVYWDGNKNIWMVLD